MLTDAKCEAFRQRALFWREYNGYFNCSSVAYSGCTCALFSELYGSALSLLVCAAHKHHQREVKSRFFIIRANDGQTKEESEVRNRSQGCILNFKHIIILVRFRSHIRRQICSRIFPPFSWMTHACVLGTVVCVD